MQYLDMDQNSPIFTFWIRIRNLSIAAIKSGYAWSFFFNPVRDYQAGSVLVINVVDSDPGILVGSGISLNADLSQQNKVVSIYISMLDPDPIFSWGSDFDSFFFISIESRLGSVRDP